MHHRVVTFVLAGGRGHRLYPLTKERAKPAVPFGGKYRIIDFVLSNLINSGVYSIYVLVQYKSQSMLRHLRDGWQFGSLLNNQFIIPVPAQMRSVGETWYKGTADAIYQNLNLIEDIDGHLVAIFGADHVYRMNIREMIEFHRQRCAEVTVAAIPIAADLSSEFGVIEATPDGTILGFHEKKAEAPTMPGDPQRVYASMGNYIFSAATLLRELHADALRLIVAGHVDQAAVLLGRHYALSGVVSPGEGRGRTLGCPTANLRLPPDRVVPADGIYASVAILDQERYDAVAYIGTRSTFDGGERGLEVSILDGIHELYGQTLTVEFIGRIRGDAQFDSGEALSPQISADVNSARDILRRYHETIGGR